MTNLHSDLLPNHSDRLREYLSKAEALAAVAAIADLDACTSEIANNYLWALSDMIHEARVIYEKALPK